MPSNSSRGGHSQSKNDYNDKKLYRKVRNRLSQQAFRRRRAENLKTLQERLNSSYKPQSETIARLEEENRDLRMQLIKVQTQLSRFVVNTQLLNDSISHALDPNPSNKSTTNQDADSQSQNVSESTNDNIYHFNELLDFSSIDIDATFHAEERVSGLVLLIILWTTRIDSPVVDALHVPRELPASQFSSAEVGSCQCCDTSNTFQLSSCLLQKNWADPNSAFSDHVEALHQFLKLNFVSENRGNRFESLS
ncbi:hypothetical protein M441DRAFT_457151 [Trichoderma asperellum CBS 433.97]|uniref:BZIP domain-containing protein n=1 Tax=Trichoderma asperellum (strain ATCC 204424 / CBS 433.97 / NBRC 101777) TaxID=1042311 RepID=A0A2T3Z940_TRIA4|nr:hypothetical protein M441DRAFT_457151 [Trichoderma asperellum CBS 433.97]PTB41315.1 hypothetical protein M441DRAFT_457151 [Trichoderma asperellum CBS 433.97]